MRNPDFTDEWIVEFLVMALEVFCQEHEVKEFDTRTAARFAIAFRERTSFEWTPSSRQVYKILAVRPDGQGRIAYVYNFNDLNHDLTQELHESFVRACGGCFPQPTPAN